MGMASAKFGGRSTEPGRKFREDYFCDQGTTHIDTVSVTRRALMSDIGAALHKPREKSE